MKFLVDDYKTYGNPTELRKTKQAPERKKIRADHFQELVDKTAAYPHSTIDKLAHNVKDKKKHEKHASDKSHSTGNKRRKST